VTHRIISDLASNPSIELYHPIPLTEQWLLKFGFEREQAKQPSSIAYCLFGAECNDFHVEYDDIMEAWQIYLEDHFWIQRQIHHIHQLQNIYHSLTGEELTIKDLTL
jgi:hypothetical protein